MIVILVHGFVYSLHNNDGDYTIKLWQIYYDFTSPHCLQKKTSATRELLHLHLVHAYELYESFGWALSSLLRVVETRQPHV